MSTSNLIRPGGRSRPGRLVALLTVTAVAASLLSAPSSPAPAAASPAPAADPGVAAGLLPGGAEPVAVTLITGDTVLWQDTGDGSPRMEIEQAPRDYPVTFDQSGTQQDFYVIPTDVMEHVVAGTVDEELFNVPGLIRQGLDDATTDELPVIVTFDHDRSTQQLARDADALPATSNPTALEKVNGAGVRVNRGKAGTFRQAVLGEPEPESSTRAAGAMGLDGAVEQVLLDRVLQIDMAESVPQIGAPQAWDAGYTGEGVTVAVLDTGIDASHPDLTGQVVAEANFTDEPDATDTHGHGTHVASTIAGTGAASGGARTGVAPGADLLNGKVCRPTPDGNGVCQTSWIMAGMEWATVQQGADVVNMSLGGGATDGSDPLSQLVDQLSAETGALFVTSAGNSGNHDFVLHAVGAPAAADAALAVGAVDKSDRMASFSSRGPRVGDHAVKPEITAPGVGIVAARAKGTAVGSVVDDHYTSLNGTSMSSPHVAGAAALLAQATDLAGHDLKNALVSTAVDGGHRWYAQGTGRVDVAAALASPVYAQGTMNFGGVDGQAQRDLVYTNRSQNDITLTLQAVATDHRGQPHDGITLSADTITVPAHGTASVTVTVTLEVSELTGQETFGGVITATRPDDVALRTGIGFGPPLHRITVEVLDSNGQRIGSDTAPDWLVSLTHDSLDRAVGGVEVYEFPTREGVAVGHVPAGVYTVLINAIEDQPGASFEITRISMLAEVEVDIGAHTTIVLDARDAVPIDVTVPREADKRNHMVSMIRQLVGADGPTFSINALGEGWPMYATPAPAGELASLSLLVNWTLAEPQPVQPLPWVDAELCFARPTSCYSETPAYVYNLPILYENGIPDDLHKRINRRDLVEVPSRFHSEHSDAFINQRFLPWLLFAPAFPDGVRVWFRPGVVTEYFLADDRVAWVRTPTIERRADGEPPQLFRLFSDDRFPAAEAGARRPEERWYEAPLRMGVWDIRDESLDNPRQFNRWAATSRNGPNGEWFAVPFHAIGNTRGHGSDTNTASWRMWNTDTDTELARTGLVFPLAPGTATYRLEQIVEFPASYPFLTGQDITTWTFTSRPSSAQVPRPYQCWIQQAPRQDVCQIQPLIRLEYDLGLDIRNRARAGRAHVFTITAGHHSKAIDRAPVTSLQVQASFDNGDTWQKARVLGKPRNSFDTGGLLPSTEPYQQYRVLLRIPPLHRTIGSVSLRVQGTDANGGTIDQVIYGAFLLK